MRTIVPVRSVSPSSVEAVSDYRTPSVDIHTFNFESNRDYRRVGTIQNTYGGSRCAGKQKNLEHPSPIECGHHPDLKEADLIDIFTELGQKEGFITFSSSCFK
jgi:hypothetical protein